MEDKGFCLKTEEITITPTKEEDLWESDWVVAFRKGEKEQIGTASFAGEKLLGTVPLRVELAPKYRNRGIGTEVIKTMVNWAFLHKNIYEVTSLVEHENDKGVNALQKAGFVFRSSEANMETYSILKEKTVWTGVYIVVGIAAGTLLGLILNNLWLGFAIGLILCLFIGRSLDDNARKYRESVTGKKGQYGKRPKK